MEAADPADFTADFSGIEYPQSVDEENSQEQHDLDNDLTDPISILMHRNPDLKDEDAAAQFLKHRAINRMLKSQGDNATGLGAGTGVTLEALLSAMKPNDQMMQDVMGEDGGSTGAGNLERFVFGEGDLEVVE